MRVDTAYRTSIINSLKSRFSNIEDSLKQIQPGTFNQNESNLNLYYEISYFVESIFQNELTRNLFTNLLTYEQTVKSTEVYTGTINQICTLTLSIVEVLENHPELHKFSDQSNHWSNPFHKISGQPTMYNFKEVLEQLRERFDEHKNYQIAESTFQVLVEAIKRWDRDLRPGFEPALIDTLNELHRLLKELEYHSNFRVNFRYVRSAQTIHLIYSSLNPRFLNEDIITSMLTNSIQKGEWHENNQSLTQDCKKILNYIELELNNTHIIDQVVSRFRAFMELYQTDDQANEKDCQKEFERFLFLNGYYPVSEARLGSGRLDSLAFDIENAFLYEHKYVDNLSDLKQKLASSAIQASIFQSRLQGLSRISNNVFIIIFTLEAFEIDGSTSVVLNGVTFNVVIISLDKSAPSSINKMPRIPVMEIIKGA